MAGYEGTLFYRLLTDPVGNLLDVAEMGRFPSRNLTAALRFRHGVCANPICHVGSSDLVGLRASDLRRRVG